jgi:sugar transferase (PEP-CTERM system associated)
LIRFLNAYFPSRTVFLGLSEALLVIVAFVSAAVARLGASDAAMMLSYEQGFLKIAVISVVFVTCMYYFDLYDSSTLRNRRELLTRLIQVVGTVCVLLAILYYVYPPLELGRGIFAIGVALVGIVLLLWRRLFLAINSQSEFAERALLFGDGPLAVPLMREVESRPELGLRIVSHFVVPNNGITQAQANSESQPEGAPLSSAVEDLFRAVRTHRVNRILLAFGDRRGKLPVEPLLTLKSRGVRIQDGTDVYEAITGKVPIESLRLGWLLFSPGFCVSRFLLVYKRLASVLIALLGLLLSLPLLPWIALAIKLSSQGQIFYRQKRVGRSGKVFECYKFRTMYVDAEADSGPTWAGDDDPRITPVGRFLRISRLDEIPQLWNVLKGDMSLVGPRPERPEFVEWLSREISHYQLRHIVRPGITGWAQIRFRYGSSVEDAKEKLRYDLFYVKNISPGLDFLVLFETIKIILLGRGAQ